MLLHACYWFMSLKHVLCLHGSVPYSRKCLQDIKFCGLWLWWEFTNITSAKMFSVWGRGLGVVVGRVTQPSAMLEYNLLYVTWLLFCTGMWRLFRTANLSDYTLENCLWSHQPNCDAVLEHLVSTVPSLEAAAFEGCEGLHYWSETVFQSIIT